MQARRHSSVSARPSSLVPTLECTHCARNDRRNGGTPTAGGHSGAVAHLHGVRAVVDRPADVEGLRPVRIGIAHEKSDNRQQCSGHTHSAPRTTVGACLTLCAVAMSDGWIATVCTAQPMRCRPLTETRRRWPRGERTEPDDCRCRCRADPYRWQTSTRPVCTASPVFAAFPGCGSA